MASLSGSKQVKFGKAFRAPFDSNYVKRGMFNGIYEDPTYLTFKVEFGGWGRSQESLVNSNIYVDDADYNNVWNANFDDYPMGLFDMNFVLPNDPSSNNYYQKTDIYGTVSRYNAVNWLYTRHEDMRAEYLQSFIEGITSLQTYNPYFITQVSGIDSILDFNATRGQRLKTDAKLTFTFNDSIDQRVRTLFELYRKAAWDDEWQRWILPQNLREFKMILYISEIRDFAAPHKVSEDKKKDESKKKLTILDSTIERTGLNDMGNAVSSWILTNQEALEYDDKCIAPVYAFECSPCEFEITPIYSSSYKVTPEDKNEDLNFSVKVKNVRTYMTNKVIDKIGELVISDQVQIAKRIWGSKNPSKLELDVFDKPYKVWLRRDFFTGLYNEAQGNEKDFLLTHGVNGTISDDNHIKVHNEEFFKDMENAAETGGFLMANIRRLLGVTGNQFLLKNFSLTQFIEENLLNLLYSNLRRILLLNGGLMAESQMNAQITHDMLESWKRTLMRFAGNDSSYLDEIDNSLDTLMDKLQHNQDLLMNIYQGSQDMAAMLNERRTELMHGAKLEGESPILDFIKTNLEETNANLDFQDAPLDDTSLNLQFNEMKLDETTPDLQFVKTSLEDPGLNLKFQDAPLENASLNLKFQDAQLDLTSPDLIFAAAELEKPHLDLKFQDAQLEDNEPNMQFVKTSLEGVDPNLHFIDTQLEDASNLMKFVNVELEDNKKNLQFANASLYDNPKNLQFRAAKLENSSTPLKFNKVTLEEGHKNVQFMDASLVPIEKNVKLTSYDLEDIENDIKFNPVKLEDIENTMRFTDVRLEKPEHKAEFIDTKIQPSENHQQFIKDELIDTSLSMQFKDAKLEPMENTVEFKKVYLEGLDEYLVQLKSQIESLKEYKAIIDSDKESGNATKLKTIELYTELIDANLEAEKRINAAKLEMNNMDNIETHSMKMRDAELEKPAPKKLTILTGGLDDSESDRVQTIQPIDDVLEFKERWRRGMVSQNTQSKN